SRACAGDRERGEGGWKFSPTASAPHSAACSSSAAVRTPQIFTRTRPPMPLPLIAPTARLTMALSPLRRTYVMHPPPASPDPAAPPNGAPPLAPVEQELVDLWRNMSSLWGISPTMAQVHGLLFVTGEALSMDDIMARLGI